MSDTRRTNRYWGDRTPPSTKAEFFNAVTTPAPSGEGKVATIRMYGPIDSWGGYFGISTKDMGGVLDSLPDSVERIILRINSPGGEVTEAVAILNMLRAHKASIQGVVDGLAASAGSVIAAGCDETVMSPGTQMMIHKPSVITWGDAEHLRKQADTLDSFEAAITEIYQAKAGDQDWSALLAAETWLTAAETVELGLADRVAVIPDAGEAATVGEDVDTDSDEPEASWKQRVGSSIAAALPAAHKPPDSTEPGTPNRKDEAMAYGDLQAGLRERLGVTDADATDDELLAAVDEALAEQADTNSIASVVVDVSSNLPDGAIVVDRAAHEQLLADAAAGRAAKDTLDAQRRASILDGAVADGRIAPAGRQGWMTLLEKDEAGTKAVLDVMPKNTIPVTEIGRSDEVEADSTAYPAHWKR